MPANSPTIDDYLDSLPEPAQGTLRKVRAAILAAAPEGTTEGFAYGVPAFRYKKSIAGFAAYKEHCSYFPMSGKITEKLAADLTKYACSKGAIQFPVNKPLPAALIKKLVQARLAEIEGKKA